MDEIRWAFNSVNWTLYRDDAGPCMAFSSTSESHNTMDKKNMESWLIDRGLKTEEVERLFPDVEKNGEATVTVSRLRELGDRHGSSDRRGGSMGTHSLHAGESTTDL